MARLFTKISAVLPQVSANGSKISTEFIEFPKMSITFYEGEPPKSVDHRRALPG
jgi:hypothetical protein